MFKKKRFTSPTEICGLEAERQQEGMRGWKTNDLLGLILLLDYLTKNEEKKRVKIKKINMLGNFAPTSFIIICRI